MKQDIINKEEENENTSLNFIEEIIDNDIKEGVNNGRVHTRFPPEPNGYLHIGHAKSICLNFGLADRFNGHCNLRFDDTNPSKEEQEYVDAIKEDISWLGFKWHQEHYASDYFDQLYAWAIKLIKEGKAYIDEQPQEEISKQRTTPTEPGIESPYRNRPAEESLKIFEEMKNGVHADGSKILRAKIDMNSPNMHMRDPIMYRIMHAHHHRTGDKWNIYPMYDFAHGQSDYIENITHSVCTLEFENHRPLYEWFLDQIAEGDRPKQREFARLNLSYTVMSKRKLLELVEKDLVNGWDDPRMPTISGLRRRGYTPESIRNFANTIGVAKRENIIDLAVLEHCVREDLNKTAPRIMAVVDPVKLIIDNYPEDKSEMLTAENNPENENSGSREMPFSKVLYIEREDFMEDAPKKFFRLTLAKEVRLKNAYIIKGESIVKDSDGNITEIHCTYDSDSKSGSGTEASKRKVKGTLHWVSAKHAVKFKTNLYDRLFSDADPAGKKDGSDFKDYINPDSLNVLDNCYAEPSVLEAKPEDRFQFQRIGYFCVDKDSTKDNLIFNRTVTLKDSWSKQKKK
ncbi:MAG: glutamine--tRNA ligase/YqeY domain fusion protein [Bacteroidales bacterium]|jgi:glutaminyl-tRNA synthetase|nr:glutamine--tRNA ligase/YqeY domain fusion protein [Bacteroidales bacterium]